MFRVFALFSLGQSGIEKLGVRSIPMSIPVTGTRYSAADFDVNDDIRARQTIGEWTKLKLVMGSESNVTTFLGGQMRIMSLHESICVNKAEAKPRNFRRHCLYTKIMTLVERSTSPLGTIELMVTKDTIRSSTRACTP